jgi:hypothetical protein
MKALQGGALVSFIVLAITATAADWTDRGEYDIVMSLRSEPSPQKRLLLLDRWQAQFPQTALRQARRELYLAAFASLGDSARMLKTAREMLGEQASNFVGVYWCTVLVPEVTGPSADLLDIGDKSARQLLAGLDTYFAAAAKPVAASDAEWQKRKKSAGLLAHRTLGWVAWQRADFAGAAEEFRLYLDQDPSNAEISAWMGIVEGMQKDSTRKLLALWYLQRAGTLRGEGALPDEQRRSISALADKAYAVYHGSESGLEKLKADVLASAGPPADFRIETVSRDPQTPWRQIREKLESPNYISSLQSLKGIPLPLMIGTVIRAQRNGTNSLITLSMEKSGTADIELEVTPALETLPEPESQLQFERGFVQSSDKQAFPVSVLVERQYVKSAAR